MKSVWVLLLVATGLLGCGGPRRLKDGSYKIDCEDTLANCTRQVKQFCSDKGGYKVLQGDEKNALVGVPGHQKGYLVSRLVFMCADEAPPTPLKLPPRASTEPAPSPAPSVAAAPERVCVPGSTQHCIGPGACEGGQACLAGGEGYGPCECAPAAPDSNQGDGGPSASTSVR